MGKGFAFKTELTFEERSFKASKMREKYPDRVPVIVEKAGRSDLPDMEKKKFLVPEELTVASLMASIYKDHKDKDGFLYVHYSGEKTFG